MSKFPRMMQGFFEQQVKKVYEQREADLTAIKTGEDALKYVKRCRQVIRSLYPMPSTGGPANAESVGLIEHNTYRIEKLIFDSRPGLKVTANLYVPAGTGPFPCILFACGHAAAGKAEIRYQLFCAGAAQKGFLVLAYDPISQGEREQFTGVDGIRGCVSEHIVLGAKMSLLGDYFGSWRAYDGIRALDVLLERPEADPSRVGMTGNSGGGTMTTILTALEDRLTMAAPSCFINTYRRNLKNELPADTEQTPPGILAAGYELYDHLTAAAPRPTLICSKDDDYFDPRGSLEAYSFLSRIYSLLGRPEDIQRVTAPGPHGFDLELREAVYDFFARHAGLKIDPAEPEIETHSPGELSCSKGNLRSRHVVSFVRDLSNLQKTQRSGFSSKKLRELLAYPDLPDTLADHRILRPIDGYSRIAVETEEGVFAVVSYRPFDGFEFRLPATDTTVLYLPNLDEKPADDGSSVLTVSTRGSGESIYDTCGAGEYLEFYDSDYMYSAYSWMLGFPLAGRKVYDLLRVIQLLRNSGCGTFEICGRGCGALIAIYAAPFIPDLTKLKIEGCFGALEEIVNTDLSRWPQSVLVPGMLEYMDLPDITANLEKRCEVEIRNPIGPDMRFS